MLVIPAIDIRAGNCVRLQQGDYALETIYGQDPVAMALRLQTAGARALHIVDLDGAKVGRSINLVIIKKIITAVTIPVQVGGGIQSLASVEKLLKIGDTKVIIGTVALENESLIKQMLDKYGDRIIVSLDSKNGKLAKRGWLENSDQDLLETAIQLEKWGVKTFIYTDVSRDGTLTQPNFEEVKKLQSLLSVPLIVAGGVSSKADVIALSVLKVAGVIIGKAVLEGKISIQEVNNVN